MHSFEVQDFEQDVIKASEQIPVLVDFWAPWCGPCRVLGPIVEKLAAQNEGKWTLVKVNTDQHPDLAQRFQIRGIPSLKLIHRGAVIAELTGVLSMREMAQWMDDHLPTEDRDALKEGLSLLDLGKDSDALPLLEKAHQAQVPGADIALARALVFDDPQRASELLEHGGLSDLENALRTMAAALTDQALQWPESAAREPYAAGVEALRAKDLHAALEYLIRSVQLDKDYQDEAARRLVAAIFQFLGPSHDLVAELRRAFSMALY